MLASAVAQLNGNKVVVAITMLIVNLGSRYALSDLSPAHERLFSHVAFKRVVVFSMFFLATRDVVLSIIMTAAFLFVFNVLLHESSEYCILPASMRTSAGVGGASSTAVSGGAARQGRAAQRWRAQMADERRVDAAPSRLPTRPATSHPESVLIDPSQDAHSRSIPLNASTATMTPIAPTAPTSSREAFSDADHQSRGPTEEEDRSQVAIANAEDDETSSSPFNAYSGGGMLFGKEEDNENDITRATTLAFIAFDPQGARSSA